MFNDVFNPNLQFLNDLHINPIPLEYKNGMTPTLWLGEMQATLTAILAKVNSWYDELLNDLEHGGTLYQTIIEHIDSEFSTSINNLQQLLTQLENKEISDIASLQTQITTNLTNLQTQITALLYKKPSLTIALNPTNSVYTHGESINSVIVNFNVVIGSNSITKAELYRNNVLISTNTNIVAGNNSIIDANVINDDSVYFVRLYDNINYVDSEHMQYDFVYNYIYGVSIENASINSALLLTLNTIKDIKNTETCQYSCNNENIIFAYDNSYGNLTSIEQNKNNIIDAFTHSIINVNSIAYNVYVSNNALYIDSIDLTFKF